MTEDRGSALVTLDAAGLQSSGGPRTPWCRSQCEKGREESGMRAKPAYLSLAHAHSLTAAGSRTDGPSVIKNTVLEGGREPDPAA